MTERLLAILALLLIRKQMTAPELAERFAVSRRTVGRDVDKLCRAGAPVETRQGHGGGIALRSGCGLRDDWLTEGELRAVLAEVRRADGVPDESRIERTEQGKRAGERVRALRNAILGQQVVRFTYHGGGGSARRTVEPHRLAFERGEWWLLAHCRLQGEFRFFALSHMEELCVLEEGFALSEVPEARVQPEPAPPAYPMEALFAPQARDRMEEVCRAQTLTAEADGRLRLRCEFSSPEARLRWALSFGADIEVIAPEELREEIVRVCRRILQREEFP